MTFNYSSIFIGAVFLFLVNALTRFGVVGGHWAEAMNQDKGVSDWSHQKSAKRARDDSIVDQTVEFVLYAIKTFFVMGVMNLTDVDCYTHAIQLGLFFFIAYIVPELYQAYIWEERPQNLVLIKAVQGLLSTAGLTTLLYGFGTSIV